MAYEHGMAIFFDVRDHSVLVSFRDVFATLPGPYLDRQTGVAAGEAYCKAAGWKDLLKAELR